MIARACTARPWAEIALTGTAINLAVLLVAPISRPDLDVLQQPMSYYADGPWWLLQTAAFGAMGMASLAMAVALWRIRPGSVWAAVYIAGLAIAGCSAIGLMIFPMGSEGPMTFIGDTHMTAGTIGGIAQLLATLAFTIAIWNRTAWAPFQILGTIVVLVASVGALASQLEIWRPELDIPLGGTIRLVVLPLLLYWGAVALRLLRMCRTSAG